MHTSSSNLHEWSSYWWLVQERCNSIANALELVFPALTHRYGRGAPDPHRGNLEQSLSILWEIVCGECDLSCLTVVSKFHEKLSPAHQLQGAAADCMKQMLPANEVKVAKALYWELHDIKLWHNKITVY